MIGVLLAVWGGEVQSAIATMGGQFTGRVLLASTAVLLLTGATLAADRVRSADAEPFDPVAGGDLLTRINDPVPALALVDQSGDTVSLAAFQGRPCSSPLPTPIARRYVPWWSARPSKPSAPPRICRPPWSS